MKDNNTSTWSLLAYAGPAVPLRVLMMQLIVYIPPFYAAELGMDLASVGMIFFFARAWDAIIDPVVGNLSDRTRGRWGRRKPWMACGVPCLMIGLWFFASPPEDVTVTYLAVTAIFFYAAMTVVEIPYLSWGAELSRDYTQRTRIISFREAGGMIGTVIATGLPLLLLTSDNPSIREILMVFVWTVFILLPLTVILSNSVTPQGSFVDTGKVNIFQALKKMRRNKPFLRLLVGVFFFWLGGSIYNAMVLFMVDHTLGLPNSSFLWFVFAQYLAGIVGLPFVVKFANRVGKHRALIVGTLIFFGLAPLFLLIGKGNFEAAMLVFVAMGLVTSFIWVMPPALVADAIEYGMFKGQGDDAAIYMSLYYFIQKMAMAAGVGVALSLAAALGFDPSQEITPQGMDALSFVALIMPVLIAIQGAFILYNYPINAKRHDVIRRWLSRKNPVTNASE